MRIKMLTTMIASGLALASLGAQAQTADGPQELRNLRAQLATLQTKVDELEPKQQTQAAVVPATSGLSGSTASGSTASWADSTRVGGTMFLDFSHLDQESGGHSTHATGTGLDVKRFYLTVDHRFDDVWSANLTTDFNYVGSDSQTQLYVKKAYVQGAFSKWATLRVGSANTPWVPVVEDWYGFRYVENTLTDRLKYGTSADWGAHLLGGQGRFNYQVSVQNGGGYRNPSRSRGVDFEGRAGIQPIQGLMLMVGVYDGKLGQDTQTTPALHDARRYDAMLAWHRDGLRLGAEWFRADNWKNVTTPLADAADGWSLWTSYDFARASVFVRYDRANPSTQLDPGLEDTYWNAGVAFPLTRGVRVAVAYRNEHLANGGSTNVWTREIGVWGEVKW